MTRDEISLLCEQAEILLRSTTISFPEWERRVAAGKYADVKATRWWQAFDALDRAQVALGEPVPVPDPEPVPVPVPGAPKVVIPQAVIPVGVTRVDVPVGQLAASIANATAGSWLVLRGNGGEHLGTHTVARNLTLVGAPGEHAVLRGGIRLTAPLAKLLGFLIDGLGYDADGVWMNSYDNALDLMEIRNAHANGVFGGGTRSKITRTWIHHCGREFSSTLVPQKHGIYWAGGSDGLIEDDVIEDNQGHGVQLHPYSASSGVAVRKNTVLRNGSQAWGSHQGGSGIIFDAGSAPLGAIAEGNIVAWHAKECGIRKLGSTAGQIVKGNCAWQNAQGSFPKTSAFFGAGLVDGGGNVELEPFTLAAAAYGSSLYEY